MVVLQPRRGYRFGVEVYALAAFALGGDQHLPRTGVDLGAGSGVVGLLLSWRGVEVTAVERDPAWCALARANAKLSRHELRVRRGTVAGGRLWPPLAEADVVVTNPPWFHPAEGPASPDPRRAAARTMGAATVADFVDAGLLLAPRVCVVTRVEREGMLVRPGSHVARVARLGRRVVLAEVRRDSGPCVEERLDLLSVYASFGRPLSPGGRGG